MIKKSVKRIIISFVALLLISSGLAGVSLLGTAEEEKVIQSIRYNEYEAIVAGQLADIQAEVTFSDGSTEMRPIRYKTFPVDKMNDLFHSFYAEGYVEGFDEVIKQNIVVVPDQVEYMINLGSNLTETDYEASGEGVLGKQLDPTGESSENEGYNAAIQRRFPDIKNKVGSKQYGYGTAADCGDWGYVGGEYATYKVTGPVLETGRNLYEHMMFPKRGTENISVKFSLPNETGNYDIYLGFYSYWFARPIKIQMNGQMIESQYNVKPSFDTYKIKNVALGGEQTIDFLGNGLYNEALASFVCVTKADTNEYETLPAPIVPEILQLTDTELPATNLVPSTKLQVYDCRTATLLYEHMLGEEETSYTIPLSEMDLLGVTQLGVCVSNAGGMGLSAIAQRTDIERFDIDYEKAYIGGPLCLNLSASANSNIINLDVYDSEGAVILSRQTEPVTEWQDVVYIDGNGDYRIELTSERGGKSIRNISVSNIDNVDPELNVVFDMGTATKSTANSVVVGVSTKSISPIVESGCIYKGETSATDMEQGQITFSKSGNYTLYFANELGKTAALKMNVAMSAQETVVASIEEKPLNRFTQMNFVGKNGYEIAAITVYATIEDETIKMIVNGEKNNFTFNVYDEGVYFAEIVTIDGTRELVVINKTEKEKESGCNGTVRGGVSIVLIGALAVAFLKKRKKFN